ncbi:winged helix-turn-helix transcriptional regulator [Merismopedia glauca]|uniref:Transcriptional regulator n=1 Tax=Merismopedia glauca CCAP 1448/3 TaxID=1296344 RepID=A0A2T1C5J0_9CYAN|nr:winged helix-turn-helix transcriptional regulator [Merismopedia glauca]PSB03516.1 transcriptional regulator [Merismopedia glauca CCAP 1448/3]
MNLTESQTYQISCTVETTLKVIAGRWKVLILRDLSDGVKRFGELERNLVGITHKMLAQQLKELEADGIIHREVYAQVPPKVEYSLTELGTTLQPVLEAMHNWGIHYLQTRNYVLDSSKIYDDSDKASFTSDFL